LPYSLSDDAIAAEQSAVGARGGIKILLSNKNLPTKEKGENVDIYRMLP